MKYAENRSTDIMNFSVIIVCMEYLQDKYKRSFWVIDNDLENAPESGQNHHNANVSRHCAGF